MYVLRFIAGLACIIVAIVCLIAAFEKPGMLVLTLIFVALAMALIGGIEPWAPREVLLRRRYEKERRIRASPYFGIRMRVMGNIVVALGALSLYAALNVTPEKGRKHPTVIGSLIILGVGAYYAVRGAKAEELPSPPPLTKKARTREVCTTLREAIDRNDAVAAHAAALQLAELSGSSRASIEIAAHKAEQEITAVLHPVEDILKKGGPISEADAKVVESALKQLDLHLAVQKPE